jgi:nicotinamide-nucleotide amidase
MHAEIISIGDELTSGQRLDTNSQWLSQRLGELGIPVLYHTTVADDLQANIRVFQTAVDRADVVIATGGLGPTADDLTRDALAALSGRPLVLHEEVLEYIRGLFARFGRDMPPRNRVQAMFPEGCRVIPNPHGTAPGIDLDVPRPGRAPARIFALPGVPAEMTEMWQQSVAAALSERLGRRQVIRHRRIKCFGAGESHVEQMLPDLIRRGRDPSVGITVSGAVITLRITAARESEEACLAAIEPTAATIRECLGELVFGEEEDELQDAVARLLAARQLRLAVVEWGTSGLVAGWLASCGACRPWYLGGIELNSAAAAERLLGVPQSLVDQYTPVSAEIVEATARACRERMSCELALAVSDLPALDRTAAEPPRVFFALAMPARTIVRSTPYAGHPSILKERAARGALNMLRLALLRDLE